MLHLEIDEIVKKVQKPVTPAKAVVQKLLKLLDFLLRGNDKKVKKATFYEFIKID